MISFDQKKIDALAKKHDLRLVVLFGSQVTGKTHSKSDIDIGFISSTPKELDERIRIEMDFQQTLKDGRIQIVDLHRVSPILLKDVVDESTILFQEDPSVTADFFARAFRLYVETQPLREIVREKNRTYLQS